MYTFGNTSKLQIELVFMAVYFFLQEVNKGSLLEQCDKRGGELVFFMQNKWLKLYSTLQKLLLIQNAISNTTKNVDKKWIKII